MKPIIIDVREDFEFAKSHVEGALNLPPTKLMAGGIPPELSDVAKDQEIIVYCRSGARSNTAEQILRMYGFTNIVNGINEARVRQLIKK